MIGRTLKHYQIEADLGKGGMGVVYRARDTRLGRPVAVKVLPREWSEDAERRRRFMTEARAACAVNHPAIAQVYDVDEVEDVVFIAMELVEGKTVRALVRARELDLLGALEVTAQVAEGLGKAHEAGIVHRDVKADNIMVTPEGHAKILDFGLAKLQDVTDVGTAAPSGDDLSHMETIARTQVGVVMGTLRYMSPEQARGQAVDHRSDIFSLGVVLYEMVTGQLPFAGATALDTLHAIAFEETRPVTQVRANVHAGVQRVITRCLRKRAADRYPTARDLALDLRGVAKEIESGVSTQVPLRDRLEQAFAGLGDLPGGWKAPIAAALALMVFVGYSIAAGAIDVPFVVFLAIAGTFGWRRFRNRDLRLVRWFAGKVGKLPEVQAVRWSGREITVVADKAVARTFVRVHATADNLNAKLFYGDPFKVSVREAVPEDELKTLLSQSGVVYVRDDDSPKRR